MKEIDEMKRRLLYIFTAAALCASMLLTGCSRNSSGKADQTPESETAVDMKTSFDNFTRQLFEEMASSDTMTMHYLVADPESYGLETGEVTLGEFPSEWSAEDHADTEEEYEVLKSFDPAQLTERQQLDLKILMSCFETALAGDTEDLFYYQEPLSTTSGIHTYLPINFAEYTFYDKGDIEDYLVLLADVPRYFDEVLAFEKAKSEAGLFMSDESVDEVVESCETFIENPDKNALIEVFPDKLTEVSGLSAGEIEDYTKRNTTAVLESVIPAYQNLIEGLTALKGTGTNEYGIGEFEQGKAYYDYLIRYKAGVDMTAKELLDYLDEALESDYEELFALIKNDPDAYGYLYSLGDDTEIEYEEPEEMIAALLDALKADYPEPFTSEYQVKYVHPSLEESLNPAFYMIPPVDDPDHNVIYLNNGSLDDSLQVFTTLAHEGFPGHLYQVTWQMNSDAAPIILQVAPLGYTEGWATYVETNSYAWCGLDDTLAKILQINQRMNLYLYAYCDISIHTQGWTEEELGDFLADFGADEDAAHEVYRIIVTDPAAYLPYTIGDRQLYQMRQTLEEAQGKDFDPKAFHEFILNTGDCQFDILWEQFYQTFDIEPDIDADKAA